MAETTIEPPPIIYELDNEVSEIKECTFPGCKRPLGHDSRAASLVLCKEHRKCLKCGRDVLSSSELNYCIYRNLPAAHARCLATSSHTLDTEIELLNLARLLVFPDPSLSRETLRQQITKEATMICGLIPHDIQLLIVEQAQALATAVSLALSKNRREIEEQITERETNRFQKAGKEAARNNMTKADKVAETTEQKSLKMFTDMGMPLEQAKAMVSKLKSSKKDMLK